MTLSVNSLLDRSYSSSILIRQLLSVLCVFPCAVACWQSHARKVKADS